MTSVRPKLWIHGISGKMGEHIASESNQKGYDLVGGSGIDDILIANNQKLEPQTYDNWGDYLLKSDIIIDFTTPDGNKALYAKLNDLSVKSLSSKAVLIGTTGLHRNQLSDWKNLSSKRSLKLLLAPNTSVGIMLFSKIASTMQAVLKPLGFDLEMIESHHRDKIDSPSGTAKFLVNELCKYSDLKPIYGRDGKRQANEIGMASIRGGSVFGEHTLSFLGSHEELSISHRALSRKLFASGALQLGLWLLDQKNGAYGLSDIDINDFVEVLKRS